MSVSQLIYLSRATLCVDRRLLVEIAAASQERNRAAGVGGAIVFCDGCFLQVLEGAPAAIEAAFARIAADRRHGDIRVMERRDDVARAFDGWGMSCLHESTMSYAQAARASAWVEMLSRDALAGRPGSGAHRLFAELRDAIPADIEPAQQGLRAA
jgi:hypothetical protein